MLYPTQLSVKDCSCFMTFCTQFLYDKQSCLLWQCAYFFITSNFSLLSYSYQFFIEALTYSHTALSSIVVLHDFSYCKPCLVIFYKLISTICHNQKLLQKYLLQICTLFPITRKEKKKTVLTGTFS